MLVVRSQRQSAYAIIAPNATPSQTGTPTSRRTVWATSAMPPHARTSASAPPSDTTLRPAATIAAVVSGLWPPCSATGMPSGYRHAPGAEAVALEGVLQFGDAAAQRRYDREPAGDRSGRLERRLADAHDRRLGQFARGADAGVAEARHEVGIVRRQVANERRHRGRRDHRVGLALDRRRPLLGRHGRHLAPVGKRFARHLAHRLGVAGVGVRVDEGEAEDRRQLSARRRDSRCVASE